MTHTEKTWRDYARAAINRALATIKENNLTGKDAVKAIDARYPFGERKYHPYKIWLSERRLALEAMGFKEPKERTNLNPYATEVTEFFGEVIKP